MWSHKFVCLQRDCQHCKTANEECNQEYLHLSEVLAAQCVTSIYRNNMSHAYCAILWRRRQYSRGGWRAPTANNLFDHRRYAAMNSIDIESETIITVTQAARKCPSRPHVSTVWRWILNGLNGVQLESVKIGGRRFTTFEAVQRFIEATTRPDTGGASIRRTHKARLIAVEAAVEQLGNDGV